MAKPDLSMLHLPGIDKRKLTTQQWARIAIHQKQNPYAWYTPTGALQDFVMDLEKIGHHGCRHGLICGGNHAGKSFLLSAITIGLTEEPTSISNHWLKRSKFFTDRSWMHNYGPNGGRVIIAIMSGNVLNRVFKPAMDYLAPKGWFKTRRVNSDYDNEWTFPKNGWTLWALTPNQSIEQLEGVSANVILTDENFPMTMYHEAIARLRGSGVFINVQTPKWKEDANDLIEMITEFPENQRIVHYISKESTCIEHGVRGFRPHAEIKREIKHIERTDPEGAKAKIYGIPMYREGKCFKQFDENVHILPHDKCLEIIRLCDATIYGTCDPASARPNAMAWAAITPDGRVIWIAEWPEWDPGFIGAKIENTTSLAYYLQPKFIPFHKIKGMRMGPAEFCAIVKHKEDEIYRETEIISPQGSPMKSRAGKRVYARFIDKRFASWVDNTSKLTLQQQYWSYGIEFYPAEKASDDATAGHSKIRELLSFERDSSGKIVSMPMMYYSERCRNLIEHTSKIAYKPHTMRGEYTGTYNEVIDLKDKYKDYIDAQRYLLTQNIFYTEQKEEKPRKVIVLDMNGEIASPQKNHGLYQGL